MTKQEIFNTVCEHLIKQGARSITDDPCACAYRSPTGLTCAIGCLIKDVCYTPELEGNASWAHEVQNALKTSGIPYDSCADLLARLQTIHDNRLPNHWASDLANLAVQHKLEVPSCLK